jgi:hypothetical protein
MLNDGDASKFLHWSSSSRPILLLFAFDSIKEFQSIELDLKCAVSSSSCTLRIDVGIFEIVRSSHSWSNRFRPLTISNPPHSSEATLTHLILAVGQGKGQFVIVRITTDDGLALSEVTFNNRNEYDTEDILPSSIYVENNLHRLELAFFNASADPSTGRKEIDKVGCIQSAVHRPRPTQIVEHRHISARHLCAPCFDYTHFMLVRSTQARSE